MSFLELISQANLPFLGLLGLIFGALLLSCFVKVATVLAIVRAGLGLESIPSAFITGGLAVVLSFFVMYPTLQNSTKAWESNLAQGANKNIKALESAVEVWKGFLKQHTGEEELEQFIILAEELDKQTPEGGESREPEGESAEKANELRTLAPAFLITELKEAFATGLRLFLPFLVVDLLIAHILVGMGLTKLNPVLVSLPIKLMLFVLVDGWTLITTNLVTTYLS